MTSERMSPNVRGGRSLRKSIELRVEDVKWTVSFEESPSNDIPKFDFEVLNPSQPAVHKPPVLANVHLPTYYGQPSTSDPPTALLPAGDATAASTEGEYNLRALLNSSGSHGAALLLKADRVQPLTSGEKKELADIIVTHEVGRQGLHVNIPTLIWRNWAEAIVRLYPCESALTWYIQVHGKKPKGRLIVRLSNYKTSLRKKCVLPPVQRRANFSESSRSLRQVSAPRSSRHEAIQESIQESNGSREAQLWLEGNSGVDASWPLVEQNWRASSGMRQALLKTLSFDEYIDRFSFLKLDQGWKLLRIDFDLQYPGHQKAIEENFPDFKRRILGVAKRRLDYGPYREIQGLLDLIKDASSEEEDVVAVFLIAYLLTHGITVRSQRGKDVFIWRPDRLESIQSILTVVEEGTSWTTLYEERKQTLASHNVTVQPFLIGYGSLPSITTFDLVISSTVKYTFTDFKLALAVLFESFWALGGLEYPPEGRSIWAVIQGCIFKLVTPYDTLDSKSEELKRELEIVDHIPEPHTSQ